MSNADDFVKALKGKTGRAAAKEREKENQSRMAKLLKRDRATFLKGLEEHGLKPRRCGL
jgi:DNA-binding protein Fis